MGQCLALAVCLATADNATAQGGAAAATAWRVVVLDSSDPSEPVAQMFGAAIRNALTRQGDRPIEFYSEFLDTLRFRGASYDTELVSFLQRKYHERKPDLVVTVFPEALQFRERQRPVLWTETPTVFVGIPDDPPAAVPRSPGVAGVLTQVEFAGTLDLALRLQPATRRVVVVSGASDFDRMWRPRVERAILRQARPLEVTYLEGLAMPELLDRVAHLPDDAIVLQTTIFRDPRRTVLRNDATRLVASASRVPVYGPFEPSLGNGVVGGSMVPLDQEAERAGRLAVAIIDGARPESIPLDAASRPVPKVDWRQMQRFGLDERGLPPGTVVLFRPPTMWSQYRGTIVGGLVVLLVQSALIAALLVERRQRQRAEHQARARSLELAHASRLAAVGEMTASIAHQINQPLGAILSNADAAEMLLDADAPPLGEVRQILADIRRDDERAHGVVQGIRALLQRREFEVQPVDLNEAIVQVLSVLDGEAQRQRVALRADLAGDLPVVRGDRVHLQQVALNLVINGLEAAGTIPGHGHVVVRTRRGSGGGAEVTVDDSGPGIPEEQLPQIFDSFFTTKPDGMGLGLSIARSLVELHGGSISASNSPQGGATFRVVLPESHPS